MTPLVSPKAKKCKLTDVPVKVGAHVPEEVEGQLACLLLAVELVALLGLPQLVCKAVPQLVLPHVLL